MWQLNDNLTWIVMMVLMSSAPNLLARHNHWRRRSGRFEKPFSKKTADTLIYSVTLGLGIFVYQTAMYISWRVSVDDWAKAGMLCWTITILLIPACWAVAARLSVIMHQSTKYYDKHIPEEEAKAVKDEWDTCGPPRTDCGP